MDHSSYETTILGFRQEREDQLRSAELGWLNLAGLFGLHEGANTFGSGPDNDIPLTQAGVPARAGALVLKDGSVHLEGAPGVRITCNRGAPPEGALNTDRSKTPDYLGIATVTLLVIERGRDLLVRAWDSQHPNRLNFQGLRHFPIDEHYRLQAQFICYETPRLLPVDDILGNTREIPHHGQAVFELDGKECRLEAIGEADLLFFNFHDLTNGETTYPGGRFLTAGRPEGGIVELDFNKAVNPPCAYTDFATCPLPPASNRLPVRINAGEIIYHPPKKG